jgi:hypothetical protein
MGRGYENASREISECKGLHFFFFFDIPNFSKREMLRYVKEYISYMKRININLILYVTYFL